VPSLAETQLRMRRAVVNGDTASVVPLLVGGCDPERRLAIHQRHYRSSLTTAIRTKFAATAWLLGTPFLDEAANEFIREHPPATPCIAEYGEEFPRFISTRPGAAHLPYLHSFAELEWHLGQVAISADRLALTRETFSTFEIGILMDTGLLLRAGLRYLSASWPVDDLMKLYLTDTAPSQYRLAPEDVWLEVRGACGAFEINRVNAAEFIFRRAILEGQSLGDAAENAIDANAEFDVGRAFAALIESGDIIGTTTPHRGGRP
jgi:Putative DNA-binding domain